MIILFTVTNDLTYDQRMHRICGTLAENGYEVMLLGRALPHSIPLEAKAFQQKRLRCRFHKGFLFYAEYNLRLFFFLLQENYDAVCSIDLDTLPAGCFATLLRGKKRVFDAHEYFTEVPEVVGRPLIKFFWEIVARVCLPFYRHAYTVGPSLAEIFEKKYGVKFGVVRNVASTPPPTPPPNGRGDEALGVMINVTSPLPLGEGSGVGLLYQGALNEGRGVEQALTAMQILPISSPNGPYLWLAGEGDLSEKLRKMASDMGLDNKVRFLGQVKPEELKSLTAQTWLGLNLLENRGLSYYYSLANKFFDCVQAGVPVLTMNFPEYRALNAQHEVALLLDELSPEAIAGAIQKLWEDQDLYSRLHQNCLKAREEWNWQREQKVLLDIWGEVFATR